MKILVINAGSSTLKFQLMNTATGKVEAKGNVERINEGKSFLRYKANGKETIINDDIKDHKRAMELVLNQLTDPSTGVIKSVNEIDAFGHRFVNAGEKYFDPCIITDEVLEDFRNSIDFAPIHIPGGIAGIEGAMAVCPNTPNVAVFDIGFHKYIPEYAYRYAIPKKYYDEYRIRRFGFHGASHYYVTNKCAEIMGRDVKGLKIITCHLGSGASISAVKDGHSVDTSMGFTPLEGIMMNTRSGDLDPAIIEFICKKEGKSVSEVLNILNKQSGLIGANGVCSDMREILENIENPDVRRSLDMYNYRIKKYIGSYAAVLNGVDAIVFTAGVGEHTPEVREAVTNDMDYLGIKVDHDKNWNAPRGEICEISASDSKVKVFIIPTDEEYVIAKETERLIQK